MIGMSPVPRLFKTAELAGLGPLRLMFFAVLVFRTGCVLLPFYGLYLTDGLSLKPANVTLVVACFGLGGLIADFSMPATLSRLSPGRAIQAALVVQAVTLLCAIFLTQQAILVIATLIWGFCYEMVNPTCFTIIAQTTDGHTQKIAFATLRLYINVGMGIGPVIGSFLYALRVPFLLFVVNAVLGLLAAALVFAWSRRHEATLRANSATTNAWRGSWRDELRFAGFLLTAFPSQLAFALPATVLSLYLVRELHLSSVVAGVVLLVNAAMVVLFELPLNLATKHWRNVSMIVAGLACTAAGFGIIGFTSSMGVLIASTVVWTTGEMIIAPAFPSYVREISKPELLVRNMGIFSGGVNAGLLLAPVAYAITLRSPLPGGVWAFVGVLLLCSILVFVTLLSRQGRTGAPVAQGARG
jgi:predicted MFS family arabinose efflux permease